MNEQQNEQWLGTCDFNQSPHARNTPEGHYCQRRQQQVAEHPDSQLCPCRSGSGRIHTADPLRLLIVVFDALSEYDKNEVISYAEYLKARETYEQ
jgi:hypothetical protein